MFEGNDVLKIAREHENEAYVLGARAPFANKNWKGPWDCAEFASWCTYQAYGIIFGAKPPHPVHGDAYTGFWYDDAIAQNATCSVEEAIDTPGAFLLRKPGHAGIRIGHIAISCGDGTSFEAKSRNDGVGPFPSAARRPWTFGVKIPGILYAANAGTTQHAPAAGLLMIADPFMRGTKVKALQRALRDAGIDPGRIDGVFGHLTEAAVLAYQAREGLTVDGIVGPETFAALGID